MPAVQQTIEQVKRIDVDQYKYGFETKIESVKAPKGLDERTVRFISEKKGERSAITWKYPSCILRGDNSRGEFYSIAGTARPDRRRKYEEETSCRWILLI